MKSFLTIVIVCCSYFAGAQGWSLGVGAGASMWRQMRNAPGVSRQQSIGWDSDLEARYATKGRWSFGFSFNTSSYHDNQYIERETLVPGPSKIIEHRKLMVYSLRASSDYRVFDCNKTACPLLKRFSLSVGCSVAPAVYRENYKETNAEDKTEIYTVSKPYYEPAVFGGLHARLSYRLTPAITANFTSGVEFDPIRLFDDFPVFYFEPEVRFSALVGLSYKL